MYIDANGLHELNDTKGHEEGDRMLKAVASAVIRCFGQENTYRIGGDEFVVLCTDRPKGEIEDCIRSIVDQVTDAGYSVSVGMALHARDESNMRLLVKEAETCMYREKQRYYAQSEHDRRRRPAEA